jgi:DNA-binding NtrC family response regulator
MNRIINVLLVEDSEEDAWLIQREFDISGLNVATERVQSSTGLNEALDRQQWDVVISDYRMPRFSGLTALAIVRTRQPDVPFILLSGTIEESVANVAIMTGATAYTKKGDMNQLIPIIKRELQANSKRKGVGAWL